MSVNGTAPIPKRLFRVWLGPDPINPLFQQWWGEFRLMNPGWDVLTAGEDDALRLVTDPALRAIYDDLPSYAGRSDLLRMLVLLAHGGVYVDCDIRPLRPLDALPGDRPFAVCRSRTSFNNAIIGAPAQHPAVMSWLQELPDWYWKHRATASRADLLVGPSYLTHVWWGRSDVRHLPPVTAYPFKDFGLRKADRLERIKGNFSPEAVVAHLGNKKWGSVKGRGGKPAMTRSAKQPHVAATQRGPALDVTPLGTVQSVAITDVRPYPANPRKIPPKAVEQCAESIRQFGWQQPLVADKDMVLIAGHTRLQAARSLGLTRVPVVVAEGLTPDQVKAFRIADNRTHDYSSWDFTALIDELQGLDDEFAKVLDLADWKDIIDQFEERQREDDAGLDFDDDVDAMLRDKFKMTVIFESEEACDKAGPQILGIPGVVNIRYPGKALESDLT